jgi:hypothetical protein
MITLYIFLIALALLVFSLVMKNVELGLGRKIFLPSLFAWSDRIILKGLFKIRQFWSYINFKTIWLIFSLIIASIKKWLTILKRRFDHKHSPFFVKREHSNRGAVSFFLKDVSDYKKSLRDDSEKTE